MVVSFYPIFFKEIAHTSTSLTNIFNSTGNALQLELVGNRNQWNGRLLISTLINNVINDDTDDRLDTAKIPNFSHFIINMDKKPKRSQQRRNKAVVGRGGMGDYEEDYRGQQDWAPPPYYPEY